MLSLANSERNDGFVMASPTKPNNRQPRYPHQRIPSWSLGILSGQLELQSAERLGVLHAERDSS